MFMVSGVQYCGNVWRLLTHHITSAVFFVPPVPAFFTHLGKTKCGNLLSDMTRLWAAAYPHVWWLKLSQSSYVSDVIVCCQLSRRRIRSKQTSDYMKEESVWQGQGLGRWFGNIRAERIFTAVSVSALNFSSVSYQRVRSQQWKWQLNYKGLHAFSELFVLLYSRKDIPSSLTTFCNVFRKLVGRRRWKVLDLD